MSTKLSLRIHRVKCIDETGGALAERVGNDEIYLGGFAINEKGDTENIPPVGIYPHFDDGDVKTFNPPKVFKTFQLPAPNQWQAGTPFGYAVGLILIEKDAGGMEGAVKKISDKVGDLITEKLKEVKKSRANVVSSPAAPAGAASALVPIIIEALKLAAPYIIAFVKSEIIGAVRDEVFTPQSAEVSIPGPNFTWFGQLDSAEKTVRFRDHKGIYDLTYDWKLS